MAQQKLAMNAHIAERLQKEPIIWLSTVRPDQRPHLVPVGFLWDNNEEILIISKPENQKIRNIRQNKNVALALETLDVGGDVVLLDGTAEILLIPSSEVVSPAYIAKYGQTMQEMGWKLEDMIVGMIINSPLLTHKIAKELSLIRIFVLLFPDA